LLVSIAIAVSAQYDMNHTHFMHNKLAINPAYAGDKGVLAMTGIYRNQWSGIEGAPQTFSLHMHTPFLNDKNGIGLSIINDKIGLVNTTYAGVSYAYRIKVSEEATLNVGVQGRVELSRINWSESDPLNQGDNTIPTNLVSRTNPNFGTGLFLSSKKYYVGLSIPTLLKTTVYDDDPIVGVSIAEHRSYYVMGGLVMRLNRNVQFAPNALMTYNPGAPFELDLNGSFIFLEKFWVGASYRLGDSVDGLALFQINDQLRLGVAVDYTLTELQEFSPGSFEILLDFALSRSGKRLNNIRYF